MSIFRTAPNPFLNIAKEAQGETDTSVNVFSKLLDYLSRPSSAVSGFAKGIVEGDPGQAFSNVGDALTGSKKFNFSQALEAAGIGKGPSAELPLIGDVSLRGTAGLALDIFTDPLNLVSLFGVNKLARNLPKFLPLETQASIGKLHTRLLEGYEAKKAALLKKASTEIDSLRKQIISLNGETSKSLVVGKDVEKILKGKAARLAERLGQPTKTTQVIFDLVNDEPAFAAAKQTAMNTIDASFKDPARWKSYSDLFIKQNQETLQGIKTGLTTAQLADEVTRQNVGRLELLRNIHKRDMGVLGGYLVDGVQKGYRSIINIGGKPLHQLAQELGLPNVVPMTLRKSEEFIAKNLSDLAEKMNGNKFVKTIRESFGLGTGIPEFDWTVAVLKQRTKGGWQATGELANEIRKTQDTYFENLAKSYGTKELPITVKEQFMKQVVDTIESANPANTLFGPKAARKAGKAPLLQGVEDYANYLKGVLDKSYKSRAEAVEALGQDFKYLKGYFPRELTDDFKKLLADKLEGSGFLKKMMPISSKARKEDFIRLSTTQINDLFREHGYGMRHLYESLGDITLNEIPLTFDTTSPNVFYRGFEGIEDLQDGWKPRGKAAYKSSQLEKYALGEHGIIAKFTAESTTEGSIERNMADSYVRTHGKPSSPQAFYVDSAYWGDISHAKDVVKQLRKQFPEADVKLISTNYDTLTTGEKIVAKEIPFITNKSNISDELKMFTIDPAEAVINNINRATKATSEREMTAQLLKIFGKNVFDTSQHNIGLSEGLFNPAEFFANPLFKKQSQASQRRAVREIFGKHYSKVEADQILEATKSLSYNRMMELTTDPNSAKTVAETLFTKLPNQSPNTLASLYSLGVPAYAMDKRIVEEIHNMWTLKNSPESLNAFSGLLNKMNAAWSRLNLAIFPSTHFRNFLGDYWNNHLAGINPAKEWRTDGAYFHAHKLMSDLGLLGTNRASEKLDILGKINRGEITGSIKLGATTLDYKDIVKQFIDHGGMSGGLRDIATSNKAADALEKASESIFKITDKKSLNKLNPLSPEFIPSKIGVNVAEAITVENRLAHFIYQLKNGLPADEAMMSVKKYLFNYEDLSKFERNVLKTYAPFYTWTRNNLPLQVEALAKSPGKFANVMLAVNDLEDKQSKKEIPPEGIPSYVRDEFGVPVRKNEDGTYDFQLLGGYLPMTDLLKLGSPRAFGRMILKSLTPFVQAPLESLTNHNFYSGQDVSSYPNEKGKFLGMEVDKDLINAGRKIRVLNSADRLFFGEDPNDPYRKKGFTFGEEALKTLTGLKVNRLDVEKIAEKQGRNANEFASKMRSAYKRAMKMNDQTTIEYLNELMNESKSLKGKYVRSDSSK